MKRKVSLATLLLFAAFGLYSQSPLQSLDQGWQYRWGDSPFDEAAKPLWISEGEKLKWQDIDFEGRRIVIRRKAQAHGVRPLRLHDAHHSFASLALASGKSVRWVPLSSATGARS